MKRNKKQVYLFYQTLDESSLRINEMLKKLEKRFQDIFTLNHVEISKNEELQELLNIIGINIFPAVMIDDSVLFGDFNEYQFLNVLAEEMFNGDVDTLIRYDKSKDKYKLRKEYKPSSYSTLPPSSIARILTYIKEHIENK